MKPENTVAAIEYLLNGLSTDQLEQLKRDVAHKTAEVSGRIVNNRSNISERQLAPALPTLSNLIDTTIKLRTENHDETNL